MSAVGIFISAPHHGQIYIAERPRKGGLKLLWSVLPQQPTAPDVRMRRNKRREPLQVLFDHLVGAGLQRQRHNKCERLGGLEIDHKFKLGGLLPWQIGKRGSLREWCGPWWLRDNAVAVIEGISWGDTAP